jgi:hypothetical protein
MSRSVALLIACTLLFSTVPAHARVCSGVNAPATVQVAGTTLHLNGMGIREATAFQVDVYVASLYVTETSRDANAILGSDTPKRMVLRFVRDVGRDDMVEAFRDGFRKNAPGTPAAKISQLVAMVEDMQEGQVMTFTYIPGRGLEFGVQGRSKGVIEGADFARAVFALFIGPRPPNAGLRTGLLGGRCG